MSEQKKPKLYVMCGLSGSGKTTFAKRYAELHNLHYLCPDDFYRVYNGDECNHYNEFEIWMALFRALHMAEQQGIDTIVDANAPTYADRCQMLNWFPDFEHHLISIEADYELCCKNNRNRRRVIPQDEMDAMKEHFQQPNIFSEDRRWRSVSVFYNDNNKEYYLTEKSLTYDSNRSYLEVKV